MDILKLIEKDHREVKKLFKKLEGQTEKATRETTELVQQLVMEVKLHAKSEEVALYKACQGENEKLRDFALEGHIEHKLLDATLNKLLKTRPGEDGEFKAFLSVAKELFVHHAYEEEEETIFPKLRRAFSEEERTQMGEHMQSYKDKLRSRLEGTEMPMAAKPMARARKPVTAETAVAH